MSMLRCSLLTLLLVLSAAPSPAAVPDAPATAGAAVPDLTATAAAAAPGTVEALIEALGYRQQVARGMARMGTASAQRRVAAIVDRGKREQRRAALQALAARFEARFDWPTILPLMVSGWQAHLDGNHLRTLSAFLATDAGRLYAGKGLAAINEAAIDQAIHLDATIDAVFDRPADAALPRPPRLREPAPRSHAGLALRWLRLHDPEQAQVFAERKAQGLEAARQAFGATTPDGSVAPELQRILDAYVAEVRLQDLERLAVRRLVRELDRAELATLVAAFDTPAMQDLAAARARADRASGERLAALVQEAMADGLMWELLRLTMD